MPSRSHGPLRAASSLLHLGVIVTLGCGSAAPEPRACQVDADCGGAAVCRSGACQTTLHLAIASPADGTVTNAGVRVAVTVEGGSPAAVELLAVTSGGADTTVATVGPPEYAHDWNTQALPEAPYRLRARVAAGGYESQPITVVVKHTPPPAPSLAVHSPVNSRTVLASGTAEPGAVVFVYEGASAVGQGPANPDGSWSAGLTLEVGRHALVARAVDGAGNASDASAAVEVVVDLTPPQVARLLSGELQVVPPPDATNVWSRDPITVTFTKPLDPASLIDGAVLLTGSGSATVAKTLALSADGTVLTIEPASLPSVPNRLTVTLTSGLRDAAGNALVPPPAWSWALPAWQTVQLARELGGTTPMLNPPSAVDSSGLLTVLVQGSHSPTYPASLYRWTEPSADLLETNTARPGWARVDALDVTRDGRVALAIWNALGSTATCPSGNLVQDYDGSAWGTPQLVDASTARAQAMQLRFDSQGRTVLAYEVPSGAGYEVHVARSAGTSWTPLGASVVTYASSAPASWRMTIDRSDRPVMSYFSSATSFASAVWDGSTWSALPGSTGLLTAGQNPRAFYTYSGHAYAASSDASVTPNPLRVYESGSPYATPLGSPCAGCDVDGWTEDQAGAPVEIWRESATICAKRWTGSGWTALESDAPCTGSATGAVLASPGGPRAPFIAVCYVDAGYAQYARCGRYNH